jgi:predicted  nucleic acid-binding Zn-ribbon protein
MEIKRRLTRIAKSLSPQIEVMNVATEMDRMCDRFEELVNYAQEKIDRASERKGNTLASQADARRKAEEQIVFDAQKAEVEENQRDQQEAFDERNKDPGAVEILTPGVYEINDTVEEADAAVVHGKKKKKKK